MRPINYCSIFLMLKKIHQSYKFHVSINYLFFIPKNTVNYNFKKNQFVEYFRWKSAGCAEKNIKHCEKKSAKSAQQHISSIDISISDFGWFNQIVEIWCFNQIVEIRCFKQINDFSCFTQIVDF